MERRMLIIHPDDNVGVVLEDVQPGDLCRAEGRTVTAVEPVPFPHKIALEAIPAGADVRKYGQPIGYALRAIPAGALVHNHNIDCRRGREGGRT